MIMNTILEKRKMTDWFNLLKVAGSVSFGGHGSSPLFNIKYGNKVNRKHLHPDEEKEIEKDGEEN